MPTTEGNAFSNMEIQFEFGILQHVAVVYV
jgi:hypothetical protein